MNEFDVKQWERENTLRTRSVRTFPLPLLDKHNVEWCVPYAIIPMQTSDTFLQHCEEARHHANAIGHTVALFYRSLEHTPLPKYLFGARLLGSNICVAWVAPENTVVLNLSGGNYPLLAYPMVGDVLPIHATGHAKVLKVVATIPAPLVSGAYKYNTRILICVEF